MRGELARRRQIHEAEAARIVVDDARAVIEVEYHMIMTTFARGARRRRASTLAEADVGARGRKHGEPSGHAEMQDEDRTIVEVAQEVFGAPRDPFDAAAREAGGKSPRQRKTQILAPQDGPDDAAAGEGEFQPAADGFDFRQFGHGRGAQGMIGSTVEQFPTSEADIRFTTASNSRVSAFGYLTHRLVVKVGQFRDSSPFW